MDAGRAAGQDMLGLCNEMPCVLVEGPDRVGKSTITAKLSELTGMPVFKCRQEQEIFRSGQRGALMFDYGLVDFLRQTGFRFISDRSYVSEWVYANAFDRDTDWDLLDRIDEAHFNLGSKILYLYSSVVPGEIDELVPPEKYWLVKSWYDRFVSWTSCEVVSYDVDRTLGLGMTPERTAADTLACCDLLKIVVSKYVHEFGDDRMCDCGHVYYRHFDSYDDMRPIGCKYCDCRTWIKPVEEYCEHMKSGAAGSCARCEGT